MQDQRTSKRCGKCGKEKLITDFYRARTESHPEARQSYCKPCAKENAVRWRQEHPERSRQYQRTYRGQNSEHYAALDRARYARSPATRLTLEARQTPCVDCGSRLPAEIMELDHVRGVKAFGFGGKIRSRTTEEVTAEIAKCEVRCPNCHRLRHYRERESVREARAPMHQQTIPGVR